MSWGLGGGTFDLFRPQFRHRARSDGFAVIVSWGGGPLTCFVPNFATERTLTGSRYRITLCPNVKNVIASNSYHFVLLSLRENWKRYRFFKLSLEKLSL